VNLPLDCSHITIGVLDERYSQNLLDNNFSQLSKTDFYERAKSSGALFIETYMKDGETLDSMASFMNNEWKKWKMENREGKIYVTLGMGKDGHIAGVMPFPENPFLFKELFETEQDFVVGYDASIKNKIPFRSTSTISFLKIYVDYAVIYITGESKYISLRKVFAKDGKISEIPARIINTMKSKVLFTDLDISK
jgi:6-phosphogluconolactonase/glucosamine-6-phosphate isomerase/deaminase